MSGSPGLGAPSRAAGPSDRRTCSIARISVNAPRAVSAITPNASLARSGCRSATRCAPEACTTTTANECDTTSWMSRAIRARSWATACSARRSRSRSASSARCSRPARYSRSVRTPRAHPITPAKLTAAIARSAHESSATTVSPKSTRVPPTTSA